MVDVHNVSVISIFGSCKKLLKVALSPQSRNEVSMSPVEKVFESLGGPSGVQKTLGLKTAWGAAKWLNAKRIPPYRVIPVSRAVNYQITPHELDPELYPYPNDGIPFPLSDEMNHGR